MLKLHNYFDQNKFIIIKIFFTLVAIILGLMNISDLMMPVTFAQPLAEGKNKFLGCCMRSYPPNANFSNYWNQVTPENAGKWASVEGSRDAYNWSQLDNIYNYAKTNNFAYKHHAMVWGQQYPSWITTLDSANQREEVEEWIKLVGERYPNMDYVDVVNEPFNAPPPFANALGGNGKTGWDWIVTSFELARQYCSPGVKLILNEYNVLHSSTITDNYIKLIDTLKARELIDGVGIQGHYFEFKGTGYTYSVSAIKSNLNKLVATGIPVFITEFDINEPDDQVQLQNYQTYFPIFWENPGVKGITLWGYIQYEIWKTDAYLLTDRLAERPSMQWLYTYLASPIRPILISPVSEVGVVRNPVLSWHPSDSATSYQVQISISPGFSTTIVDTTVTDTTFQSVLLDANKRHYWRVNASNQIGTSFYTDAAFFITGDNYTSVENEVLSPSEYNLSQNYPNPFNPSTTISFTLPQSGFVSLVLTDILGKQVKTITEGFYNEGKYSVELNAQDLASGIYFYRIETNNFVSTKKLVIMK